MPNSRFESVGHFVSNFSYSETKVWDRINMDNVLNHVSDRSSRLTGKRRKNLRIWSMAVVIAYSPKLRRHSWRICFVYIWSELVWDFGLSEK